MRLFPLIFLFFIFIYCKAEEITVPYIESTPEVATDIPSLMKKHHVKYHDVSHVNWANKYPYKPKAQFAIAYTSTALLVVFKATEKGLLANYTHDQDPVFNDACMELFIQPEKDSIYYNIECNCLGKILMQAGTTLKPRKPASQETLDKIKRWTSLEIPHNGETKKETTWEVALILPYNIFFLHNILSLEEKMVRANVYKCGGNKSYKHFLSWNPIYTALPNFHVPQYFGRMTFNSPRTK